MPGNSDCMSVNLYEIMAKNNKGTNNKKRIQRSSEYDNQFSFKFVEGSNNAVKYDVKLEFFFL